MKKKIGEFPHEIDTEGNVWSPRGFKLKPQINANGYYRITLNHKGKQKTFRINRLVAHAFIPNQRSKIVFGMVDHIDGDKLNNIVSNLRWVSAEENAAYKRIRENRPRPSDYELMSQEYNNYKGVSES